MAFSDAPARGGHHAELILQGFKGILQVDGYAGYNRLLKEGPGIRLAYFWAHARRKLVEITRTSPAARRQFDATLPAPKKLTRGHHASIPHDEVAKFIAQLRQRQAENTAALMVEWIAVSACGQEGPGWGHGPKSTRSAWCGRSRQRA